MNISKIRHEIEVAKKFIRNDEQTIAELEAVLDDLGDVRHEAAKWRLEQSRKGLPITVLPLKLNEKLREAESVQDTIRAAKDAIAHQQEKITRLEGELARQLDASLDASWTVIAAEANRLAAILLEQQAAYTATARQLFALNALSRPGKNEWFGPETQAAFAPSFANQPRTARQQAEGLDQFGYQAFIKPTVDAAREWRNALAENPEAPSPFVAS